MLGRRDEIGSVAVLPLAVGGRPGVAFTGVDMLGARCWIKRNSY